MKKALLHACCGPCATYPSQKLKADGLEVAAYFYNPNIYPEFEYVARYASLKDYAQKSGLPLIFDFDNLNIIPGKCRTCYELRLLKTALYAKQNGFEAFSTTLLISPYQDHELIREMGEKLAAAEGIEFLYQDYRSGYPESRIISKELGLYRQKYCGCEKSQFESQERKKNYEFAQAAS